MLRRSRSPSAVAASASPIERPGRLGQLVEPAEEPDPDALRAELVGLAPDGGLEQPEQADDLVVGAGPVLAAERVQRQHRDAASDRVAEEVADGLDAGGVAVELGQVVLRAPSAGCRP